MEKQVIVHARYAAGIVLLLVSGIDVSRGEATPAAAADNSASKSANVVSQGSPPSFATFSKPSVQPDPTSAFRQLVQLEAQKRAMCRDLTVALDASGRPDPDLKSALCNYEPAKPSTVEPYVNKAVSLVKPSTVFAVSVKNWQWTHSPESEAKLVQGLINSGIKEEAAKPFVSRALLAARSTIGKRVQTFVLVSAATAVVFEFVNDADSVSATTLKDLVSGKTVEEIAADRRAKEVKASHDRWFRWSVVAGVGLIGVVVYSMLKGRVFS